jgi:hypothetical protein
MKECNAHPIVGDVSEQWISMTESCAVNASERFGRTLKQI